jgi:hypothetical protein
MGASGHFVCHQARLLFIEGLERLQTVEERRDALRKLLVELLPAVENNAELEHAIRTAYVALVEQAEDE